MCGRLVGISVLATLTIHLCANVCLDSNLTRRSDGVMEIFQMGVLERPPLWRDILDVEDD